MSISTLSKLQKAITKSYVPFQDDAEQFLLKILSGAPEPVPGCIASSEWLSPKGTGSERKASPWSKLVQANFLLPYLHRHLRLCHTSEIELSQLKLRSDLAFKKIFIQNGWRLELIQTIAREFEKRDIKAVFMKGAAELVHAHNSSVHRGQRAMDDIDLLCYPDQLASAEHLLLSMGCKYALHNFGTDSSDDERRTTALQHAEQLIYRYDVGVFPLEIELHRNVAVGRKLSGYPSDFAASLLDRTVPIKIGDVRIFVPSLEQILIQMISHAASSTNHYFLTWCENPSFAPFVNCIAADGDEFTRMQTRFDCYQLDYLFKLQNFLQQFHRSIDYKEVNRLLNSIKGRQIVDTYLQTAATLVRGAPEFSGLSGNWQDLVKRRQHLVLAQLAGTNSISNAAKAHVRQAKRLLVSR